MFLSSHVLVEVERFLVLLLMLVLVLVLLLLLLLVEVGVVGTRMRGICLVRLREWAVGALLCCTLGGEELVLTSTMCACCSRHSKGRVLMVGVVVLVSVLVPVLLLLFAGVGALAVGAVGSLAKARTPVFFVISLTSFTTRRATMFLLNVV